MEKIKYSGEVNEKGKLTIYQRKTFAMDIERNFTGMPVWVIVEKRSRKMSKSQQGYLYGVIIPRVQHGLRQTGLNLTEAETKIWLEKKFLTTYSEKLKDGNIESITRAMKDLERHELTQLIDEIIRFAAMELDEVIPFPGEFEEK